MKKIIFILSATSMIAVACTKKAMPTNSTPTPATEVVNPATGDVVPQTDAQTAADIEAKKKIEQGETKNPDAAPTVMDQGKTVFTTKCANCHAVKNSGDFTFSQWKGILQTMVPRANLTADEEKGLTAYIKANAKQ